MVARERFELSPSMSRCIFTGKVGWGPHPPHHYVEKCGGFVQVMLSTFPLPKDLAAVKVTDIFEA